MDEFRNLNWLWNTNRSTTSSLYAKKFSDDEKDVFFCHLNEIDHIHLLDNYGKNRLQTDGVFIRQDPRTGQVISKELLDHSTHSKVTLYGNFPQKSSMNSQQHEACLNAMAKLGSDENNISMTDRNNIRIYEQLKLERDNEKRKFLEFVKDEFYRRNIKNCYNLQPELDTFIKKRFEQSVESVLASNDKFYQLQSAIPISQNDDNGTISIDHEATIAESGIVFPINRNKYTNPVQLSCSFLEHFYSNHADIIVPLDQSLLERHSVDVVISLKTLTSILTSAKNLSTNWNVLFTVQPCEERNVIVFDEILPVPSFSCLEKNRLAYKYSVKAGVVVPKKKEIFSFDEKRFIQRPVHTITNHLASNSLQEIGYKVWNFEEYLTKYFDSGSPNQNPSSDSNHIRRLWNIKRNNVDCCRMMIDSSHDFCEKEKNGTAKYAHLSPKLEYQCEFGAEVMTLSELISEWCALRFGPDTLIHRVRVNARTGCILDMTELTIKDVSNDLRRLYQINAEFLLEPLLNIIEIVKRFPPNEYWLSHLAKHNNQAMVYSKSTDGRSTGTIQIADIYKSYQEDTSNLETIQWNPIDDTVCTAIHIAARVIPCAFPHWRKKVDAGKNAVARTNDRLSVVERGLRKVEEKEALKRNALAKKKSLQNHQRNRKKKLRIAARTKLNFEGESLDPNELFDDQGNIHIGSLANRKDSKEQIESKCDEGNTSSDPVCLETYCRDAAVISDDS